MDDGDDVEDVEIQLAPEADALLNFILKYRCDWRSLGVANINDFSNLLKGITEKNDLLNFCIRSAIKAFPGIVREGDDTAEAGAPPITYDNKRSVIYLFNMYI